MSLEEALKENTKAVNALVEALGNEAPKEVKPKAEKKASKKKAEPKEATLSYEDVKKKTLELLKEKGRDAVVSVIDEFGTGLKSAKDLEEGQYADYVKRVDETLAEEEDVA